MTRVIKRHWRSTLAIAALVVAFVATLPLTAARAPAPRQIVLVARGMTFVLQGESDVNPTIRLTAGERVQIVVRNETRGMVHDFAVPSLEVAIPPLSGGEAGDVSIQAPDAPGVYEYECRPHSKMMRGTIEVVAR